MGMWLSHSRNAPTSSRPRWKSAASRPRSGSSGASASVPARAPRACACPPPPSRPIWPRAAPVKNTTAFLVSASGSEDRAAARPGRDLSRRRVRRPWTDGDGGQGRNRAARLRCRRQGQDRAFRGQAQRGSAGLIVTTSKTDERSFKTSVRNGHDFLIRIAIEDCVAGQRERGHRRRCCHRRRPRPRPICATSAAC